MERILAVEPDANMGRRNELLLADIADSLYELADVSRRGAKAEEAAQRAARARDRRERVTR